MEERNILNSVAKDNTYLFNYHITNFIFLRKYKLRHRKFMILVCYAEYILKTISVMTSKVCHFSF